MCIHSLQKLIFKRKIRQSLLSLLTKHLYCRFWDECKQTQKDICLCSSQNTSFINKFIGIPVVFSLEYYEQKEFTVPWSLAKEKILLLFRYFTHFLIINEWSMLMHFLKPPFRNFRIQVIKLISVKLLIT